MQAIFLSVAAVLYACGGGGGGGTPATPDSPPAVTSTTPPDGSTGVAPNAAITATFGEAVDPTTVNETIFLLNNGPTGSVHYDPVNYIATFTPTVNLAYATTYTATIMPAQPPSSLTVKSLPPEIPGTAQAMISPW